MAADLSPDTNEHGALAMLVSDKPKRQVSQATLKDAVCFGGCGATVAVRTRPTVYCPACRLEKKRASARAAMERQRRKRGILAVKGQEISCASCAQTVVLSRRIDTRFCPRCYRAKNGVEARVRSAKKRATLEGRSYYSGWCKRRRASDPAWRLASHMRTLIHRGIGKQKAGRSWREFVPYSLEDLMTHLESQFLPGMTWENHGEWHIDHIRPLCSFNFTTPDCPQFREAWALTNLQPLWAVDNLRKGGRWAA